ncbi:fibrinogen beta chain-like [Haliotis rufescens]|uniref:fibrinogen beta chain-like n=1 Tax=Haliotis rufescens TaxID=6454 RepID=UPI00201E78E4|nr:fibrinogen beta chain-like [Haliotis rufescens]
MRISILTMIPETSILLLAITISVVLAERRRVPFVNCPSAKANSNLMTTTPARSRIECSVTCLNEQNCLSASYCKTSDGYTCQLSGIYTGGGCSGLGSDGECTLTAVEFPCDNGGTFIPENRTCHCVQGFIGSYCQRRYRDCLETPLGNDEYLIQPLESDFVFQWPCTSSSLFDIEVSEYNLATNANYTLSWEQMKHGFPILPGMYYFIGLEILHELTKQGMYNLVVEVIRFVKDAGIVRYKNFRVDSEADGYACHWDSVTFSNDKYLDGFGAVGDATKSMNGARFGTFDNDVNGCARAESVSWWHNPIGCTMMKFDPDGLYWPVNRTGVVEMEKMDIAKIGLAHVYWYVDDDLIL